MRKRILAFVFAAALLAAMAVPLFGGGGTALAGKPTFETFDMDDLFATETTGASGFGKVRATQEGCIEVSGVNAKNLRPDHAYEVTVTIQLAVPGDFTGDVDIVTSAAITSDADGDLEINDFDLGCLDPGTYRLDVFVTHIHATVAGSGPTGEFLTTLLDRDPLLACQPAPMVVVE